jgi:hypothetical protein
MEREQESFSLMSLIEAVYQYSKIGDKKIYTAMARALGPYLFRELGMAIDSNMRQSPPSIMRIVPEDRMEEYHCEDNADPIFLRREYIETLRSLCAKILDREPSFSKEPEDNCPSP